MSCFLALSVCSMHKMQERKHGDHNIPDMLACGYVNCEAWEAHDPMTAREFVSKGLSSLQSSN